MHQVRVFAKVSEFLFFSSIFLNKDLPPEGDVTGKIWQQIFLTLSTKDSKYCLFFRFYLKFFREFWESGTTSQVTEIPAFDNFLFFEFQTPPTENHFKYQLVDLRVLTRHILVSTRFIIHRLAISMDNILGKKIGIPSDIWNNFAHEHRLLK